MSTYSTGVYLQDTHKDKVKRMAQEIGCSRNRVIQLMIEAATLVEPTPPVKVELKTNGADPVKNTGAIL